MLNQPIIPIIAFLIFMAILAYYGAKDADRARKEQQDRAQRNYDIGFKDGKSNLPPRTVKHHFYTKGYLDGINLYFKIKDKC